MVTEKNTFTTLISCDTAAYRKFFDNKAVKNKIEMAKEYGEEGYSHDGSYDRDRRYSHDGNSYGGSYEGPYLFQVGLIKKRKRRILIFLPF